MNRRFRLESIPIGVAVLIVYMITAVGFLSFYIVYTLFTLFTEGTL